uniref:14-3-3 domain-containing protein n=1 Tax=Acrobeloides nanus TaxID=290746 RepID=A0A914CZ81_9BILA
MEPCHSYSHLKAGCHEDVVKVLKRIVELDLTGEISADARHMFATAYKQLVSNIRTSWRIVSSREQRTSSELTRKIATEYRNNLSQELRELCTEIITTIDEHLMPKVETSDEEAKIYYLKMKADYYRYICEVMKGDERKEMAEKAKLDYEKAFELAKNKLPLAHPTRLAEKAVQLANQTFDEASAELAELDEESYKESALILHLIKENLLLWSDDEATMQASIN